MLVHTIITDKIIATYTNQQKVSELRCRKHPELKLRFRKNRQKASWLVWHKKQWYKVGTWPRINTKAARKSLHDVQHKLSQNVSATLHGEQFMTVTQLLDWYVPRVQTNRNLSRQRIKDITSAVRCHLQPSLGEDLIINITRSSLDKSLIWPLQSRVAKSTVGKYYSVLKAAFRASFDLNLIATNPLSNVKLSDFGKFQTQPKGSKLKPPQVLALLTHLNTQPCMLRVICLLQLSLGTRIGETRKIRWCNTHFGDVPTLYLPAQDTKTGKEHTIQLPRQMVHLLRQWQYTQHQQHYRGPFVFPNRTQTDHLSDNTTYKLIKGASQGQWQSHDLRKCAKLCWINQEVDFLVTERMLNHSLGKVAEAYLDTTAQRQRLTALTKHTTWLEQQCPGCFSLVDTQSTPAVIAYPAHVFCHAA